MANERSYTVSVVLVTYVTAKSPAHAEVAVRDTLEELTTRTTGAMFKPESIRTIRVEEIDDRHDH